MRRIPIATLLDEREDRPAEFPKDVPVELVRIDGPMVVAFDPDECELILMEAWEAPDRMCGTVQDHLGADEAGD